MTFASYGPTQKAEVIAVLVRWRRFAGKGADLQKTERSLTTSSLRSHQDDAASLGINVIRTWAFCDGQRSGAAQPAAGEYDERVLRALDYVLAAARARGLRLLLTLTNYWDDFGGIQQYVEWAQASGDTSAGYKECACLFLARAHLPPSLDRASLHAQPFSRPPRASRCT